MRLPRFARNDEKRVGGWGLAGKPGNYKNLEARSKKGDGSVV